MEFRQCWYDMKEIGIEIHESPVPVNGDMSIALYSDNMQLMTLFHAHMCHLEEKNSPMYDEDMYKAEIEDTLLIFNIEISFAIFSSKNLANAQANLYDVISSVI